MKVMLALLGGARGGEEILIEQAETLLGRDPKCDIHFDSEDVSREHCLVSVIGRRVFLRDVGSSNGTYVNRRLLRGELQLESGDTIQIGHQLITISVHQDADEPVSTDSALDDAPLPAREHEPTVISRAPLLDPDAIASINASRLDERLRDLKAESVADDEDSRLEDRLRELKRGES